MDTHNIIRNICRDFPEDISYVVIFARRKDGNRCNNLIKVKKIINKNLIDNYNLYSLNYQDLLIKYNARLYLFFGERPESDYYFRDFYRGDMYYQFDIDKIISTEETNEIIEEIKSCGVRETFIHNTPHGIHIIFRVSNISVYNKIKSIQNKNIDVFGVANIIL